MRVSCVGGRSCEGLRVDGLDGGAATRAGGDERDGGLDLGGEVPVGAGALDAVARSAATTAPVAGDGLPAARAGRAPRAAVSTSTASTRVSPSTERRSLRAADQPIETWSSCIARRRDRVDARPGTASRFSSETIAAWVYCAIMWPESTPGSSARNGGRPWLRGRVEEPVGAPLADRGDVGGDDRQEVEHVGDRRAVEVAVGLDPAVRRSPPGCRRRRRARGRRPARRGRRCRGRRRAPAASSAASRRPGPGCTPGRGGWPRSPSRPAARAGWRRDAAWPGCGRSACRSAAKTRVGAEQRPRRSSRRRRRRVRAAARRSAIASTSMPSMPSVPLISARPSFSRQLDGRRCPAAASASAAAISVAVRRRGPRPRPSARARSATAGRGRRSSRASRTRAPPG